MEIKNILIAAFMFLPMGLHGLTSDAQYPVCDKSVKVWGKALGKSLPSEVRNKTRVIVEAVSERNRAENPKFAEMGFWIVRSISTNGVTYLVLHKFPRVSRLKEDGDSLLSSMDFLSPILVTVRTDGDKARSRDRTEPLSDVVSALMAHNDSRSILNNHKDSDCKILLEAAQQVIEQINQIKKKNSYGVSLMDLKILGDKQIFDLRDVSNSPATESVLDYTKAKIEGDVAKVTSLMAPKDSALFLEQVAVFKNPKTASVTLARIALNDFESRRLLFTLGMDGMFLYAYTTTFPMEHTGVNVFSLESGVWKMATCEKIDVLDEFQPLAFLAKELLVMQAEYEILISE